MSQEVAGFGVTWGEAIAWDAFIMNRKEGVMGLRYKDKMTLTTLATSDCALWCITP